MNVLLITGEYPPMPGGIAGYTAALRSHLDDAGVQTIVMSRAISSADIRVESWGWDTGARIREVIAGNGIDVVHIQYQSGAFDMHPAINLLPRTVKTPVVTTFHDLRVPYLFPKAGPLRRLAVKRMARWSSAVIVTNPADKRLLAASSIDPEVIHLGPSLPAPDVVPEPGDAVGFFGFPSAQKGFDILLQALSRIPSAQRPPLKIVGSKPPVTGAHGYFSERDVDRRALELGVQVMWTGFLEPERAISELASCRVIAFPFPAGATLRSSALIAATQARRPVIVTRPHVDGDLDGLDEMPQICLVDRDDTEEIRRMIQSTPEPCAGFANLPLSFTWPEIARQHRDVYLRLTGRQAH